MSKNRLLIGSNIFILFVLIFIFLPLNVDFALKNASEEAVKRIEKSIAPYRERGVSLSVEVKNPEAKEILVRNLEKAGFKILPEKQNLTLRAEIIKTRGRVAVTLKVLEGAEEVAASHVNVFWTSILPPLIAVFFAIIFRQVLVALGFGVWLGSYLYFDFAFFDGTRNVVDRYIYNAVADEFHIWVMIFTGSLLGLVALINRCGGTQGLIDIFKGWIKNSRTTQLVASFMGLFIFFDDYANCMVVGTTMRPWTDRLRVSREKLAYIVDSTSAPVAGLAVISTWIGYEVGLFQDVLNFLEIPVSGYEMFFKIVPYRFYCIFAIVFVFLTIVLKREFGSMYRAERRAYHKREPIALGARPMLSRTFTNIDIKEGAVPRWYNAFIPIFVVILMTIVGLYFSGGGEELRKTGSGWFELSLWQHCFSNADNAYVLGMASLSGSFVAIVMILSQGFMKLGEALETWLLGLKAFSIAAGILILAWAIGEVCRDLSTSIYLISVFKDIVPPYLTPILVFLISGIIAFSTGTSWGTMAIMIPTAIPLAYEVGGLPMVILSMGAVLDGSIFGDHCSPISDTTIMSSIASSCDHIDHVRTQLPYALVCMLVATGGYLLAAFGVLPLFSWGFGLIALLIVLLLFGKDPSKEAN